MKGSKLISIILSICFSVFLGHNLIPHHHHAEILSVPISSECPVDHGGHSDDDHDSEEHPVHCHAFNDVVFDKYSTTKIQPTFRLIGTFMVPVHQLLQDPYENPGFSGFNRFKIPDKITKYFGARSLRAPPFQA